MNDSFSILSYSRWDLREQYWWLLTRELLEWRPLHRWHWLILVPMLTRIQVRRHCQNCSAHASLYEEIYVTKWNFLARHFLADVVAPLVGKSLASSQGKHKQSQESHSLNLYYENNHTGCLERERWPYLAERGCSFIRRCVTIRVGSISYRGIKSRPLSPWDGKTVISGIFDFLY